MPGLTAHEHINNSPFTFQLAIPVSVRRRVSACVRQMECIIKDVDAN